MRHSCMYFEETPWDFSKVGCRRGTFWSQASTAEVCSYSLWAGKQDIIPVQLLHAPFLSAENDVWMPRKIQGYGFLRLAKCSCNWPIPFVGRVARRWKAVLLSCITLCFIRRKYLPAWYYMYSVIHSASINMVFEMFKRSEVVFSEKCPVSGSEPQAAPQ